MRLRLGFQLFSITLSIPSRDKPVSDAKTWKELSEANLNVVQREWWTLFSSLISNSKFLIWGTSDPLLPGY